MLKKLGEEHAQYEFMKSLAAKCGYFFFGREHVGAMTKEVLVYKDSENERDLVAPSLQLLVVSRALFIGYRVRLDDQCWTMWVSGDPLLGRVSDEP